MSTLKLASVSLLAVASFGCASTGQQIDTRGLTLVEENHATVEHGAQRYILDSFIVPFQQPYYIRVQREVPGPLSSAEAVSIAKAYIEPRGCTQPLVRRPDLDRVNSDKTQWLIGIEC